MAIEMEQINTSALRAGDVIYHFGLRLRIDREIRELGGDGDEATRATSALIENWDKVAGFVGDLALIDESGGRRWTVKGNNRAIWTRELASRDGAPGLGEGTVCR